MIVIKAIGIASLILGWIFLLNNLDKYSSTIKIDPNHPYSLIFFAMGTICTMISSFFN